MCAHARITYFICLINIYQTHNSVLGIVPSTMNDVIAVVSALMEITTYPCALLDEGKLFKTKHQSELYNMEKVNATGL